jgi:predicted O-methyltransferase YrrM
MITRDDLEQAMGGGIAFIHPDEIEAFCSYARDAHRMVEIGTGFGACACLMLHSSAPTATVISIDPFLVDTHGTWQSSAKQARAHVQNAGRALKFDANRWTLIEALSHDAAQSATKAGAMFDLVFVDGDHTYEGVAQDVNDWLPLLRVGGIMLLHDSRRLPNMPAHEFHRGWPGPTQAADDLRSDVRVVLVGEVHSLTAWRKA